MVFSGGSKKIRMQTNYQRGQFATLITFQKCFTLHESIVIIEANIWCSPILKKVSSHFFLGFILFFVNHASQFPNALYLSRTDHHPTHCDNLNHGACQYLDTTQFFNFRYELLMKILQNSLNIIKFRLKTGHGMLINVKIFFYFDSQMFLFNLFQTVFDN